jgi:hypothetical protein
LRLSGYSGGRASFRLEEAPFVEHDAVNEINIPVKPAI